MRRSVHDWVAGVKCQWGCAPGIAAQCAPYCPIKSAMQVTLSNVCACMVVSLGKSLGGRPAKVLAKMLMQLGLLVVG